MCSTPLSQKNEFFEYHFGSLDASDVNHCCSKTCIIIAYNYILCYLICNQILGDVKFLAYLSIKVRMQD